MANVTVIPARRRRIQMNEVQEIPKIKVAAYCRVSTDSDEQATSYEMQVEHYTEYITKNPEWELVDIYADDGISGTNTKKRDIDVRMKELQLKLVDLNTTKLESEDLSRDVNALREEKDRIMITIAEDKGRQLKKEEMIRFLQEQTAGLDEFDDVLVRKLVEQVVVHGDGTFTVEFKSGELVEL